MAGDSAIQICEQDGSLLPNAPTGKYILFLSTDGGWKKKDDAGVITTTYDIDVDVKVKVSAADTTEGFLDDKVTVTAGKLTKSITSPAGDEGLNFTIGADVFDKVTDDTDDITEGLAKFVAAGDVTKLGFITVTQAVDLDTMESDIAINNAKVTNATHTGEVTGATSLTIDKTAITGKALVTAVAGDHVLITDGTDSDNLKKVDVVDFLGGGGGGSNLYEAVVDASGGGDYLLPSAAFNAGKITVFVRNGVYTETVDVVIPNKGVMVGESAGGVVLNMSGSVSVKCDGSGGTKETAGSISVSNNSPNVTGSGTTFTNLSAGDYILIGHIFHEILSITNATVLVLTDQYQGNTDSGLAYTAQTMSVGVAIRDLTIANSTIEGLYFRAVRHSVVENILVTACGGTTKSNIFVEDSGSNRLLGIASTFCQYTTGHGLAMDNSYTITINNSEFNNNLQSGISIMNPCNNIIINATQCCNNDSRGIDVAGGVKGVTIGTCNLSYNEDHGMYSSGTARDIVVTGCTAVQNGSDGIANTSGRGSTSGNTCYSNASDGIWAGDESSVTGNSCSENGSNGISLHNAIQTVVSGNNLFENTGNGIITSGTANRNVITANVITDNDGAAGVNISVIGNTNNIVTNNVVYSNTTADIVDSGTGTVLANNVTT